MGAPEIGDDAGVEACQSLFRKKLSRQYTAIVNSGDDRIFRFL